MHLSQSVLQQGVCGVQGCAVSWRATSRIVSANLMSGDVNGATSCIHYQKLAALNKGDRLCLVLDDGHGSGFWLIQQVQVPANTTATTAV